MLTASGALPNGEPFSVNTPPFQGDPIKMAEQVAAGLISPPQTQGTVSMSGQATDLLARVRGIREAREAKLAATERVIVARIDDIQARQDAALSKIEIAAEEAAAEQENVVRELEDEVNRLTNGGPAA